MRARPNYSAVELFNERATATTDSFELDDADVPAVLEICRRLHGVSLALKLAAARAANRLVSATAASYKVRRYTGL
jgi:predicted ATPase